MSVGRRTRLAAASASACALTQLAVAQAATTTPVASASLARTGVAPAAPPPTNVLGAARLAGTFELAGRITTAVRVRGERKGQRFIRRWSFASFCQVGPCQTVALLRGRSNGNDEIALTRKRPGYYTGTGSFYAPLKCGKTVVRRGQYVPFSVTVTVTAATRDPTGAIVATRVNATYTNKSRRNRTRCLAFLGHDAAAYHGHVLIGRSPAGS